MDSADRCGFVYTDDGGTDHCCYRERWNGTDRCIWHAADFDGVKPGDSLAAVRREGSLDGVGELLDGARLPEVTLPAGLDLAGVSLRDAELPGGTLRNAALRSADLTDAELTDADLEGADLRDANLTDADLSDTDLRGADLRGADLRDANLTGADLRRADLREADCRSADFEDARLSNADLTAATLNTADFTGATLRAATLRAADLEGALLDRANLYDADLTDARLYGAVFGSARANEETTFDERCVYDPGRADAITDVDDDPDPLTRAIGTYHQLERLCLNNALLRDHSRYFVRRQDAHAVQYRREGHLGRWVRARVARAVLLYGESPFRVLGVALLVVGLSTLFYPLGYLRDSTTGQLLTYPPLGQPLALAHTLLDSLYFSTLSFTTMTYGHFVPVGVGKFVAMSETGAGVMLAALLVFVLGRRATR